MEYLELGAYRFNSPFITSFACAVGPKENDGYLNGKFDFVSDTTDLNEETWEKAESELQKNAFKKALEKSSVTESEMCAVFGGDLLNQCVASSYTMRDADVPFLGIYGACSTFSEGLFLGGFFASALKNSNVNVCAIASSHFCSAERQFRLPLNYGGQRTPSAQWTVTGAGAAVISDKPNESTDFKIMIAGGLIGRVCDMNVTDPNNMGAAMAGAAYCSISDYIKATNTTVDDYDLIVTGDLGTTGKNILTDLFCKDGLCTENFVDCGEIIYKPEQDTHSGGSGCGCSATVMCADIFPKIQDGTFKRILFGGTGALMSPTLCLQGESIPGVCHIVELVAF